MSGGASGSSAGATDEPGRCGAEASSGAAEVTLTQETRGQSAGSKPAARKTPEKSFRELLLAVLARANEKHQVAMDEIAQGATPFLRDHLETLRRVLLLIKLGQDPLEWLEPHGQHIRACLATVHSLFLSWKRRLSPDSPDRETAAFLAESVVFALQDNILNAHDHFMEDGDRLLFDSRKCRIIFGVSPINGDRRFSMWYETLQSQLVGSPDTHLIDEIGRRVVDAQAQMDLTLEQEKMQAVQMMRAKQGMVTLHVLWRAWIGECPSLESKARGRRAGGRPVGPAAADAEAAQRRERLLRKLRQKRENCRTGKK